ncbi:MAG: DegT/DnrJ/EryC1/StrS family aminotransferase [Candidatus Bathyarchaeia archaeon]
MRKRDLAIFGRPKAIQFDSSDVFAWPRITMEVEEAVFEVLRAGKMSDIDVTEKFEREFAEWLDMEYAFGHNNGTAALHRAMFGIGIRKGDEVVCSVDVRQPPGSLPVSGKIQERVFSVPWFKQYRPEIIEEYRYAFKKVIENYRELLPRSLS